MRLDKGKNWLRCHRGDPYGIVNRVKPMWKAALHPKSLYSSMFQSG